MILSVIRAGVFLFAFATACSLRAAVVLPSLATNLICRYDFDHPTPATGAKESDLGRSGTELNLINGGTAMRTNDGAYPGSLFALQTQQLSPATTSNDDWKAGIYNASGVASLSNFSAVQSTGLWEAVITIPPAASNSVTANSTVGVVDKPRLMTSKPKVWLPPVLGHSRSIFWPVTKITNSRSAPSCQKKAQQAGQAPGPALEKVWLACCAGHFFSLLFFFC